MVNIGYTKMSKLEQDKYNVHFFEAKEQKEAKDQKYLLEKVSDDMFGGAHPNGIDKGHMIVGFFDEVPTVGENFTIKGDRFGRYLITSVVEEIIDEETFKTVNSTYKLTKY